MGLLSKKDSKLILDPLADNNPITIQVLGICSALAITAELKASIVMSLSVLFVMGVVPHEPNGTGGYLYWGVPFLRKVDFFNLLIFSKA